MKRTDVVYLQDILDAIERIEKYVVDVSFEEFSRHHLLQDGVVLRLEMIGEACNGLSDHFQDAHPEIPWGQIVGMRNRLAHGYFDINLRVVWDAATVDLPLLKTQVRKWRDEL
jgi:uncharacterized protein with HEPN domain